MLRVLALRCGLALFAGASLAMANAACARDLRAADTQPEDFPTVRALQFMDRIVRERTDGRHRILVFHSRELGEERETIEQTRVGVIDLNRVSVALLGDFIPEANVLSLPFLFRSPDHLHAVLDGPIGEEILASFTEHGLIGLAYYDAGARSFYNARRPVRRVEDMRGLRIRVQHSGLMLAAVRTLGAEPVPMAFGQIATGLSAGLIDGAENNWASYVTTGNYQSAPFFTLTEHSMTPGVLVMSRKAWSELDEDDRRIFREAAQESAIHMRGLWRSFEARSRTLALNAGVTVIEDFDRAPFADAMDEVYREFVTDDRMRSLVRRIKATR